MHADFEPMQEIPGGAYTVLESITDAFFALNTEWQFTYLNRQAELVLAHEHGAVLGKTIWSVYPGLAGSEFEERYRTAAREQTATSFTAFYKDQDRWYEVHVYPSKIGLSVYFRNVTERIRTEETLRESEMRFRLMADSIPQMVWIVNGAGTGVFFNKQWSTYTGVAIDSMDPKDVSHTFIHPDDHAATLQAWSVARSDGRVFNVEHRIRSASGEYRWFLVRAEPYRDPATGEIVRWFGTSTDVHDRKLAEALLKKSEERYRSLFDSIDEGFCIIDLLFDADGKPVDYLFCEINPMFEQQTGLRNAAGKTARELSPHLEKHWFEIYGKVAVTGEPIRFENESKAMNRWFDVYAFRIDDPAEHRVAILFKDITRQKLADEKMRASEFNALSAAHEAEAGRQRLNAVLEAVPVGISVHDAAGALLLSNAAHRHLWGEHPPLARGVDEFGEWKGWWADGSARHGQRLQAHEWTIARVLLGQDATHDVIEIESFGEQPVRHVVLNSGAPIKDDKGAIVGAVVAKMDITDRIKAEEALKQADQRKDEFLAMLAHELRNPQAPIAAAADLLALSQLNEERVRQTSAVITRQVRHMTGLVDDLLDVSRVTRGLVTLNREKLNAKRVVSDAVEQVRPMIESRGHRLTVRTPPESAFVMGDQKRLVQAMTNLLNNAAKYTPEGGDIVLTMEVDGESVRMTVEDNGTGMSPELAARAFELFTQAERTSDRSQGGLGIGLALVKSLVELHGGSVSVYSEGVGKGSRFTVCLPHLTEQTEASGAEQATATRTRPGGGLNVMVVDDNADAAQMLGMFLDALGHQVFVEHSSRKALAHASMRKPDVCLLDIGLPDIDGNELARRMRAQAETADTILIAITGYGQEQDRKNAMDAGFDYHFVKPVDSARLAQLMAHLMDGAEAAPGAGS